MAEEKRDQSKRAAIGIFESPGSEIRNVFIKGFNTGIMVDDGTGLIVDGVFAVDVDTAVDIETLDNGSVSNLRMIDGGSEVSKKRRRKYFNGWRQGK